VRIAAWTFIVMTALAAVSMLVPAVELQIGGIAMSRTTSLSLYQAATNEDFAARFVVAYNESRAKKVGPAVVKALSPRVGGRLRDMLGDAGDAMDALSGVNKDDAEALGTVLMATVFTFLGLQVLAIGLLFGDAIEGAIRRRRATLALSVALLSAVAAIAIHLVERRVVAEANDELGVTLAGLGPGAYLLPVASCVALAAAIGLLIAVRRGMTSVSRPPGRPPTGGPQAPGTPL
jgi:hypothetical protein